MAKRFKAAIIGGSGYGGAEMARRLLMHPDVELVRVASIDHVGEPLGAVHPNLDGATDLTFEDLAAGRGREGLRRRAARPAAQGHRREGAGADRRRREDRRHVRRLPAARRRHLREVLRREAPAPRAARHVRLRPARAQPRRDQDARSTSRRPAASRPTIELALLPLARAGLLDGATVHVTGITGSSGSGIAPARRHAPPEPRRQPQDVQAARAPARARDRPDARPTPARRTSSCSSCPVSAPLTRGIFATCFVELPAEVDAAQARRAVRRDATRASRSRGGPRSGCPRSSRSPARTTCEVGFAVGPVADGKRTVTLLLGDRQPDQGRRRPGDPEHEPRARLRRAREPRRRRELAVSRVVVKIGGEVVGSGEAAAARRRICARSSTAARGSRSSTAAARRPPSCRSGSASPTTQVAGRRVTDAATLDVMKMVVAGKLNVDLCATLLAAGLSPVGLHGASGHVVARRAAPAEGLRRRRARPGRPRPRRRRHRLQPRPARDAVGRGPRAGDRVPRRRRRRRRLQHQRRHGRQPARRRAAAPSGCSS